MKLTPENIRKIEAVLTFVEEGNGNRATIIEFGLRDLQIFSSFMSCLRTLGVDLRRGSFRGLSPKDKAEFIAWLREKKKQEAAAPLQMGERAP